jgi:hypothetical protein
MRNGRVRSLPCPAYTDAWQEIRAKIIKRLIVGPERAAWISQNYPPTDIGRPGILYCETAANSETDLEKA